MSEKPNKKVLPTRDQIKEADTWKLEDIFASDDLWNIEFDKLKALIPQISQYEGQLGSSAKTLLNALELRDTIGLRLEQLYTYAHMRYDQDTTNSFYQSLDERAKSLFTEAASRMSYIVPELLSLKEDKLDSLLQEEVGLQLYQHEFDTINKQRPHVLSTSEENILAQATEVTRAGSTTFNVLNNADLTFPEITDEDGDQVAVTHGRFINFLKSGDRRVRQDAFKALYQTYDKYKNTFASTLSSQVKRDNFFAHVRKYDSARHAALSSNHIPEKVYDQLVQTVNEHLPLLHRYIELRKRVFQLDELHMYDMYTPLIQDVDFKVPYEEAQQILLKALQPLGNEYIDILKEAYQNRWVDVYENKGKRSGAYSSGSYSTNPYILMNWQDDISELFTLAHEFGHSVHSYYTRKNQPYVYGNYTIFVAEVASTCNENLLIDYLLEHTDDVNKKKYLLNHYLETFRGTVFRQTMFAEFELLIHKKAQAGEPLTPDLLSSLYYELNQKYFGPNVHIDQEIALEWSRIPHFYYNYYVYQYATGFSAATALSKQILEEGKPAVDRYLDFLKAGSSDYPIEVLKKAGVDMNAATPIQQAFTVFEEKLSQLESLLA
ncbi:oligoendopeptidase F [Hazenella sp. IB182357]|uniref:Oligopeptidase F n=1 Tax=Polycladospora coralii TaxID=2771432 RepID=A0A926NBZ8_9BACL|nr:oligoendopeptidase F [Polycladospora coralii]MBD1373467.1 oligoendopeptidase F [Polycladospora coralii]MBS7530771.1 oligoendopeptidase F [Polycladospora coralii]